jgi:3-isopropylmalate/(R)-2-methylmalate dehydratase small subunit
VNIQTNALVRRGRCHIFGDDIPLDEGLIPFELAIRRIDDPALLIDHLLKLVDPHFPARVRQGDIVVAGRNFGCGKPHLQGFIAMAALNLGVICHSMPYKAFRGAISKGVPVLQISDPSLSHLQPEDEIEVDFSKGTITRIADRLGLATEPLSPTLQSIIAAGGTRGKLQQWLRENPQAPDS